MKKSLRYGTYFMEVIVVTERERLIELLMQGELEADKQGVFNCSRSKWKAEIVADYLLENGVIVMPLNMIGNTLWFINCDDNIVCDKIYRIIISDRHDVYIFLQNSDNESYELSDIGKFLFLTREEAEKALAERSDT